MTTGFNLATMLHKYNYIPEVCDLIKELAEAKEINLDAHEKVVVAKEMARRWHADQTRKWSGDPYIVHPERVFNLVCEYFPNETTMQCAAWLHDVLEDCNHPRMKEQISNYCGAEVLSLVQEMTNPSKGSKANRAERKKMDRDHLRNASFHCKCLKLIDRVDNLNDMEGAEKGFVRLYLKESQLLLEESLRHVHNELEEKLQFTIDNLNGKISK